jgi:D-glycero-D-manno-heptose 1,7-bisphosphate phosphatase
VGVDALAIVDRDGTIVESVLAADGTVTSAFAPEQLRFLPGAIEGLRVLQSGYRLAIATNQPGAAKGQATRAAIERTNAVLVTMLAAEGITIAHVEVCLHHPVGGPGGEVALVGPCECRKPAPGMALALLARFGADPARSWMIGDSAVDEAAGRAAGLRTALVGTATLLDIAKQIMRIG